jgi:intracellular septation protein A
MTIFLILAPYGAFTLLMLATSATTSLFAATAVCLAVITIDLIHGRSIKILSAGTAVLFAAIGLYLMLVDPALGNSKVKLAVDAGVLAIALTSLLIRRPFTLQYAREAVDAETAKLPGFMRANYIITSAWAGAFLLMAIANVAMIYVPDLPLWSGLVIAFAARNGAAYFTKWYPAYRKARHGTPPAGALPAA